MSSRLTWRHRYSGATRSPAYERAVAALLGLPLEQRSRAAAEALSDDMRQSFARSKSMKPTRGGRLWRRVLGRKHGPALDDGLPGDDHVSLWVKGREAIYVSQPYDLNLETLKAIVAACEEHGLTVHIDGGSWHFAGRTVFVTYEKANRLSR